MDVSMTQLEVRGSFFGLARDRRRRDLSEVYPSQSPKRTFLRRVYFSAWRRARWMVVYITNKILHIHALAGVHIILIQMYTNVHAHKHTNIHPPIHPHTHSPTHTLTHTYIRTLVLHNSHAHTNTHTYTHMYIHTYEFSGWSQGQGGTW
jgi:hypothetical protein